MTNHNQLNDAMNQWELKENASAGKRTWPSSDYSGCYVVGKSFFFN